MEAGRKRARERLSQVTKREILWVEKRGAEAVQTDARRQVWVRGRQATHHGNENHT